jgi:molybdate transport system substrate-binding protein
MKSVASEYGKSSEDKIVFNFGASNFLARQIEAGAPADIFFSADEAQMDTLQKKNLIATTTRRNRLSNSLVIVIANDSSLRITSPNDLTNSQIKRLALGDPAGVPAGIYAKRYLETQKLWSALQPKIVPTDNVRAALAAIELGNVEAAIVYKTDAAISKKTKVAFEIPATASPPIHYPVAVLKGGTQPKAAQKFLDYLFTPAATTIFEKFRFTVE